MGPEFVRRHAPLLALPPRGGAKGWVTPSQEGGLTPPENMYSEQSGMPLPYMQEQGGARQFYVPEGETATNLTPLEPPLPLRGFQNEQFPAPGAERAPTNLLRPTTPRGPIEGLRGETTPPGTPGPYGGPVGRAHSPPAAGGGRGVTYPGQRGRVPLISRDQAEERIMANVSRGADIHAAESIRGRQTLADLLQDLNIQIPNIRLPTMNNRGRQEQQPVRRSYTSTSMIGSEYGTPAPEIDPRYFDPNTGTGDYFQALGEEYRANRELDRQESRARNARPR